MIEKNLESILYAIPANGTPRLFRWHNGRLQWSPVRLFRLWRDLPLDYGEDQPDIDCVTLPNGECVAPNCRLHGPMTDETRQRLRKAQTDD